MCMSIEVEADRGPGTCRVPSLRPLVDVFPPLQTILGASSTLRGRLITWLTTHTCRSAPRIHM